MKVGVFTPLLSQLPLADVVKKLKGNGCRSTGIWNGELSGRRALQAVDAGGQRKIGGV